MATAAQKVDAHHASDVKNWSAFERNLKNKAFNKAVQLHPASDDKLKRYTDQMYKYLKSPRTVQKAKSETTPRQKYEIKVLPSGGLGCGCKDWQYKRSHSGQDCKHIRAYKAKYHQPQTVAPTVKTSSVLAGIALARTVERAERQKAKARQVERYTKPA